MMATELVRPSCMNEENMEIPLIPPGFESFATFNIKKMEDRETMTTCSASTSASESHTIQMQTVLESSDSKMTRSLRRRTGMSYSRFDDCSENEFDSEQNLLQRPCLPKGVIRGCKDCSNCQTVTAQWRPEEACRPDLEDAPVFYPNEEEFKDTLEYIANIRPRAEKYGICRIVPPPSWKPPCPLLEKNIWGESKFRTRVQRVDKLQNRDSVKKMMMTYNSKRKRRRCTKDVVYCTGAGTDLGSCGAGVRVPEYFGFEPGPEFTLDSFQKFANDFKEQYFRKYGNVADPANDMTAHQSQWDPSVENIEGEYWRMVEKPTEEMEVLYGADLETGAFGSGFPKLCNQGSSVLDNLHEKYVKSGWNLNNFPKLPGSVLSYESSDISGVLVPWLYIGMCFSSFCWHVEDHYLYSLNYMHWGAPKLWYGVPGEEALKLEAAMRKHLPDLFEEQPDLLHKLVTQLSPTILKSEGVPVYRCIQNPGEFVLTFPRAYHSGFNCGFNCAEAVNVAPVDWLPHGYDAIELYRKQGRKTSVSHDKLLLGAAREAVKAHWELDLLRKNTSDNLRWKNVCGTDGILSKALKTRVEIELVRRESLCISSHAVKMESSFDATNERECCVCLFDLHLSAVGCHCSPERYTCLYHANHLCSCSWNAKFYLFRYDINELNILVDAVEGKLSSVYRWARLDLGLALSSHTSKDNLQVTGLTGNSSCSSEGKTLTDTSSRPPMPSLKVIIKKEHVDKVPKSCKTNGRVPPLQKKMPVEVVLALEAVKTSFTLPNSLHKVKEGNSGSPVKKEGINHLCSLRTSLPQISQQDKCSIYILAAEKHVVEKNSFSLNGNLICLSDDESKESNASIPGKEKQASAELTENSERLSGSSDTVSANNCMKDPKPNSNNHIPDTAAMGEKSADEERNSYSSSSDSVRDGSSIKCEIHPISNPVNLFSCKVSSCTDSDKPVQNLLNSIGTGDCNITNDGSYSRHGQPCGNKMPESEDRHRSELTANLISTGDMQSTSGRPSNTQRNVDPYFRQKGPRVAKVVRRINCNVEPMEYGVVHSGKFWCDSQAIFPKGFRSRVRYINVLDPTSMCYYVSEILDGGLDRPLFMVSLEHCPSEVFVHVSAGKCWEMVRERVNQEITKQHRSGKPRLHPLQPPGSLDGLEMFGFSSPEIVQVIQAMDKNRNCAEYWKSRPLMQISQHLSCEQNSENLSMRNDISNDQEPGKSCSVPFEVDLVLGGLLDKANPSELQALYSVWRGNKSTRDEGVVSTLINQEIHNRRR